MRTRKTSIEINGIDIYFEEYYHSPHQETYVLIHGFLSSSFSFRKLLPFLSAENNVISIDIPPFGKSGKISRFQYSYENISSTILFLLVSLGYKQVYIIGHSMGGQIALNMMLQRPSFIHKGILLASSGYMAKSKRSLRLLSHFPFFNYYVRRYLNQTGVEGNLKQVVYDTTCIDQEMYDGYLQPFLDANIFRALTRMVRDREGDLPVEKLNYIKTPCLLIWGDHDRIVPLHIGERLVNDLPNADLIVLKNTGHLLPEEKPEDVYRKIKEFVQQ